MFWEKAEISHSSPVKEVVVIALIGSWQFSEWNCSIIDENFFSSVAWHLEADVDSWVDFYFQVEILDSFVNRAILCKMDKNNVIQKLQQSWIF